MDAPFGEISLRLRRRHGADCNAESPKRQRHGEEPACSAPTVCACVPPLAERLALARWQAAEASQGHACAVAGHRRDREASPNRKGPAMRARAFSLPKPLCHRKLAPATARRSPCPACPSPPERTIARTSPAGPTSRTRRSSRPITTSWSSWRRAALWTVANKIEPWQPKSASVPVLWRYRDLREHVLRSVELVTPEKAGRRVIYLNNPGRRDVVGRGRLALFGPAGDASGRGRHRARALGLGAALHHGGHAAPTPSSTATR